MKKILFLLTLAAMASCKSSNTASNAVPAIDTANFDRSIAINEDFYQFATGGWQKNHPLKDEFARYGAFDLLRENNETRLNNLFKELSSKETQEGGVERKIADLYKMGLDSVKLNKEGAAPVMKDVKEIMTIKTKTDLLHGLAEIHLVGGAVLFNISVAPDLVNSSINVLNISQAGLGMGDKDYYLKPENAKIKEAYVAYLNKIAMLAGFTKEEAAAMVNDDMEVEMVLANGFFSNVELRDVERGYNPMSKSAFAAKYKGFDWNEYFKLMGIPDFETIIVNQPSAVEGFNQIMSKIPVEKVRNYLAIQTIDGAAGELSDDFYAASFDFYGKVMTGAKEQKPRWKRAMSVPNFALGEAVGELYVAKYFKKEDKDKMLNLVKNLQKSLGEHIAALDWMSDSTKAKAQEKLAAFTIKIGYPDKWKDYSTLKVDPSLSYWDNCNNVNRWYVADNLKDLGKPVDKDRWYMTPQTVNAYYNPTSNEICFPAAILQPPFYNSTADDAVNYGAIGVVIGHEMTHGFDDQGRLFDKNGNMANWWSAEDAAAFKAKTDILVKQYDSIKVLPNLFANGALSLGENIADQGGLRVAYTAFKNAQKEAAKATGNSSSDPEKIDGFTPDQRFYIAYATVWAQNIRNEEIERLTKQDVHSLGKNRTNAALKNIDSFYEAFGIEDGAMFLPKEKRVVIW